MEASGLYWTSAYMKMLTLSHYFNSGSRRLDGVPGFGMYFYIPVIQSPDVICCSVGSEHFQFTMLPFSSTAATLESVKVMMVVTAYL